MHGGDVLITQYWALDVLGDLVLQDNLDIGEALQMYQHARQGLLYCLGFDHYSVQEIDGKIRALTMPR